MVGDNLAALILVFWTISDIKMDMHTNCVSLASDDEGPRLAASRDTDAACALGIKESHDQSEGQVAHDSTSTGDKVRGLEVPLLSHSVRDVQVFLPLLTASYSLAVFVILLYFLISVVSLLLKMEKTSSGGSLIQ